MNYAVLLAAALSLCAGSAAGAEEPQKPATGASAQGAAQGQATATAGREGAGASGSAAGAAGAQADGSSASLAQGTEVSATLTKPVDAGKAKPGDPVEARAAKDVRSGGTVLVPRGSKLFGRVTHAEPRGGGSQGGKSPSRLGIVFERAVLKDGSSVALNGAVAAIATAQAAGNSGGGAVDGGASGSGGPAGGAAGAAGNVAGGVGGTVSGVAGAVGNLGTTVGGAASAAARSPGAVGGLDVSGHLRTGSRGVFGPGDLQIVGAGQGSGEGSVIRSTQRTVRLEGGTQMLIVAGASAGKPAEPAAEKPVREPAD